MKSTRFQILASRALLVLGLTQSLHGQSAPYAAWQFTQAVEVPGTGLVRLELPAATTGASNPRLSDMRLVSPEGIETPYVVEWPRPQPQGDLLARSFHASLVGQTTVLEFSGINQPFRAITLVTSAPSFIKAAVLEGSNDGAEWQTVATNEVIFRQIDGTTHLRIPFKPASWQRLRVTINDNRSEPVPFTGAHIEIEKPSPPTIALPVSIQKREELHGHTRLTVPLGAANLWMAELKVQTSDPLFSRSVVLWANNRPIGSGRLFRVALDGHESSVLTIPIEAQALTTEVVVDINNGDSPPLKIDSVEATRYPVSVAFHSSASGHWQLFTGNPAAPAPVYDVAALSDELRNASAVAASAAALVPNPSFDKSATLPETGETGAAIDLKGWAFRAPIITTQRGVMQLELGLEALAHATAEFGDLRLVQAGHQLPYVLQPILTTRDMDVTFTAVPDAKRPSVSRWELTLPMKGMPVTALRATSPTPLFARHFNLMEPLRDSYGNHSLSIIGSEAWSQKPGADSPLTMLLSLRATSGTLFLETDNGDNSPVKLDKMTVSHPVVQLLFKTVDAAPIQLYYGNPQAITPRYDLSLMEKELRTAAPLSAALGTEEQLKPVADASIGESKGSPWLWAALAVVVGGLLWIVARLLPQTEK